MHRAQCKVVATMNESVSESEVISEAVQGNGRPTRKRILDSTEPHEDEGSTRRPPIFQDWQEKLKSIVIPNKRGYCGLSNELLYNEVDQRLADNFEDSLTGLGVDISMATYNMSEAIMALPNVNLFKQEIVSPVQEKGSPYSNPATFDDSSQSNTADRLFKLLNSDNEVPPSPMFNKFHSFLPVPSEHDKQSSSLNSASDKSTSDDFCMPSTTENNSISSCSSHKDHENNKFQYILGAATSVATKLTEETLSYLNQGQSYEIKVKKQGDLTRCQGRFFHTIIRIGFHERRLQYTEKEQLKSWQQMRPGERILEVDVPLSYGITDVIQDPKCLNVCEFDWDPTKEVGVYVKVNCISTEFTPKKHGGEKGVPFRIQIETYSQQDGALERLHVCACQIKVFKLKGADRKHKQDREKISKRPPAEQEKYQQQYECTILMEISPDALYIPSSDEDSPGTIASSAEGILVSPSVISESTPSLSAAPSIPKIEECSRLEEKQEDSVTAKPLSPGATAVDTQQWLTVHRFTKYLTMFSSYSGIDMLRLTRSEMKEMVGLADGIRLYNALHAKSLAPLLTLYICLEHEQVYNAIYLENLTWVELVVKICRLMNIQPGLVHDVYLQGPSDIHILVNDEVVRNFKDETTATLDILQDTAGEKYRLLLKPTNSKITNFIS